MDKYTGCNIVESVVTPIERAAPKRKAKSYILLRLLAAAVIIGVILAVRYIDVPWLAAVRDGLKAVFCYDVFGRTAGSSAFF